jgi:uncharacterized protein DUF3383
MTTIPAGQIVSVTPNVLAAGGDNLVMNGLFLTSSARVPSGTVQAFSTPTAVASFFGATSAEAAAAAIYFNGFDNANQQPGSILFASYPQGADPAYIRGGNVSGITLAQLQAITGSLNIAVDGFAHNAASVVLSSATSFSSAAGLIQTALNAGLPTLASVTGSIAPVSSTFTGGIVGNVMTVTTVPSNTLVNGAVITGTGVTAGTYIENQLTGTAGGIGTYAVSASQVVAAGTSLTGAYGTLTVTVVGSGTLSINETLAGAGVTSGTQITALGTGTGGTGTYFVNPSQTASSTTITATASNVAVAYDSVSGAFTITSGGLAQGSTTVAFATGTIAATLALTQGTGATLSQGAAGQTPIAFMNSIITNYQNWASLVLVQDPDSGVVGLGTAAQKYQFAQWAGGAAGSTTMGDRYCFICWDTDPTPTTSSSASSSLGALIAAAQLDGTCVIWGVDNTKACFIAGFIAAIDFEETNGRATAAFKSQSGLVADVTNALVASNLIANGYNFYGAYGTANVFFYPGSVSGKFQWLDSQVNEIWMNSSFKVDLMTLLTAVKSIPYNQAGDDMIEAACMDTVNAALNFGAIRAGVTLSAAQTIEVNSAANANIAPTLQQRGWYLQVADASPTVRQARGSPPCTFFYMDGQSVQKISLTSVELK